MKDWYEKEQYICPTCKHRWALISDRAITDEQHDIWIHWVEKQHKEIHENLHS